MSTSTGKRKFTLTLPKGLHTSLHGLSVDSGISLNKYLNRTLRAHVKALNAPSDEVSIVDSTRASKLDKLLDDGLVKALQNNPEAIGQLDAGVIAKLAVARAPKARAQDEDLQKTYMSLTTALEGLPDVGTLNADLKESKREIVRLKIQLKYARKEFKTAPVGAFENAVKDWMRSGY